MFYNSRSIDQSIPMPLILSLLMHLFIIKFVAFTFSASQTSPHPTFIFFGSILENRDFIDLKTPNQGPISSRKSDLAVPYSQSYFNPIRITTVTKPSFPGESGQGDKNFIKSTFLDENTKTKNFSDDFENDLYLPPIVPLRLNVRQW
jgi:hypothetical protein